MSIYDTILANTQQGYQNLANQQMQMAQQPTFADKFLAGLKERDQVEFQRKMAESNYAMNLAYKQAQEEQMKQNQKLHNAQMVSLGAKYVSQNLMGEATRGPVVETLKQMGLPSSMVPELQYETSTIRQNVPSDFSTPEMMMAEEPYSETTIKTPIPYSDWGAEAAFKQKGLDLREQIAQMSNESKLWIAQHKGMEPKDALQKLIFDYANSQNDPDPMKRMSANDFAQRKFFLTAKASPVAVALAGQGEKVPLWSSGSMAVSPNQIPPTPQGYAPNAEPMPSVPTVRSPQTSKQPVAPQFPENLTPKGRKEFAETAIKAMVSVDSASRIAKDARALAEHPGLVTGTGFTGKMSEYSPFATDASAFQAKLNTLGGQIMIDELVNHIKAANATLGQLSDKEGVVLRGLRGSLESGKLKPKAMRETLLEIAERTERIIQYAKEAYKWRAGAVGASPDIPTPEVAPSGESPIISKSGKFQWDPQNETWVPRGGGK